MRATLIDIFFSFLPPFLALILSMFGAITGNQLVFLFICFLCYGLGNASFMINRAIKEFRYPFLIADKTDQFASESYLPSEAETSSAGYIGNSSPSAGHNELLLEKNTLTE